MSPKNDPLSLSSRTTIILLSILPAVVLFALLMGIWHCIRKRNIARRKKAEDIERDKTLRQRAFLAIDSELPERSRGTRHQVPKTRVFNLPELKVDTNVPSEMQVQPAPTVGLRAF